MILLTYVQILPSGQAVAERRAAGLALAPFRGVRYAQDRVSGLAEVTSPPYDVIARDAEGQLRAADPHNIVRLILPRRQPGQSGDPYQDASAALALWQRDGILVRDPEPALYVYEQAIAADGAMTGNGGLAPARVIQRGLIGALRLMPPEAGVVLPHEDVAPGPVTDRRQLMEATQANLEPIFLLYDGSADHHASWHRGASDTGCGQGRSAATQVVDAVAAREPLSDTMTSDGLRHRMWAITDPGELAMIEADLAPRQALIADGHHRYAAYRQMQEHQRRAGTGGGGPWDLGLAMLVDSAAYPPQIAAIHRVIPGLAPQAAADRAEPAFRVRRLAGGGAGLDSALAAQAAAAGQGPAFLIAGAGDAFLLTDPDPGQAADAMPSGRSARWRSLAPAILQELLMRSLWGIADDERRVRIVHDDAAAAVRAAAEEPPGTAVISSPVPAADVYAVAALGERVPRKSTSFSPKPRTGMVIRTFADS